MKPFFKKIASLLLLMQYKSGKKRADLNKSLLTKLIKKMIGSTAQVEGLNVLLKQAFKLYPPTICDQVQYTSKEELLD